MTTFTKLVLSATSYTVVMVGLSAAMLAEGSHHGFAAFLALVASMTFFANLLIGDSCDEVDEPRVEKNVVVAASTAAGAWFAAAVAARYDPAYTSDPDTAAWNTFSYYGYAVLCAGLAIGCIFLAIKTLRIKRPWIFTICSIEAFSIGIGLLAPTPNVAVMVGLGGVAVLALIGYLGRARAMVTA